MSPDAPRSPARGWRAVLVTSLVIAALATGSSVVAIAARGERAPAASVAAYQLVSWGWWALVAPLIALVVRRAPFLRAPTMRSHLRAAGIHVALALTLAVVHATVAAAVVRRTADLAGPEPTLGRLVVSYLLSQWLYELVIYAALAGAWEAAGLLRALRERDANAARLEARLATAQLQALTMQLQPHFLFNTLQGIATLVDHDPPAARALLHRLAGLLRTVLDAGATPEVPLAQELAIVGEYLAIEGARFPDRLVVRSEVADDVRDALVPVLLLQPLVENAIRHAVAPRIAPTTITLAAHAEGTTLVLAVRDDGDGHDPARPAAGTGLGLANTRARLAQRHGPRATLAVESRPGAGTTVVLRLPLLRATAPAPRAPLAAATVP